MSPYADMPTAHLRLLAEGCTELTCPYHGEINAELRKRDTDSPDRQPSTPRRV